MILFNLFCICKAFTLSEERECLTSKLIFRGKAFPTTEILPTAPLEIESTIDKSSPEII